MRCFAGALLLIAVVFSQGCARTPAIAEEREPAVERVADQRQPVAAVQPQDKEMGCLELYAEIQVNALKISDFSADQQGLKEFHKNRGQLFTPHWFGTDWREATDRELQTLLIRQQYLMALLAKKKEKIGDKERECLPRPKRN
jgi:hypothetical protein